MKKLIVLLCLVTFPVWATVQQATTPTRYVGLSSDTKPTEGVKAGDEFLETDTMIRYVCVSSSSNRCASWTAARTVSEQQYSLCIDDADKVCKASAGFVHSVWCYGEDAAATAGTVRLTNTATAGGAETTEVWGDDFAAAAYSPRGAVLDVVMDTGIVLDFTTTADVKCGVSYR